MADYFAPIVKRILAVTSEFHELTQITQDVVRMGDKTSADVEDFMSDLEAAHQANMKVYEQGIKVSSSHDRLLAELNRLRTMPETMDKMGNIGSMALMLSDLNSHNYVEAADRLYRLEPELYYRMFKELSTYDNWPVMGPQLLSALSRVMREVSDGA